MKDSLGDRMKSQYEDRTRLSLPRRTYTIIRLDGKAFHTYTRGLARPFDDNFMSDMDDAVKEILPGIQGSQFAYIQSDEVSILLTDFEQPNTSAWFDGNIQKMCSVSASLMTAEFNKLRTVREVFDESNGEDSPVFLNIATAAFDSRVFTIPDRTEVYNYFVWRNQDCARNSVSTVAQSLYSHNELHGKNVSQMMDMMMAKGTNWAKLPEHYKNGRLVYKHEYELQSLPISSQPPEHQEFLMNSRFPRSVTHQSVWESEPAWKFTEDPERLQKMIPLYPS